jgi:hypothetical protein
MNRISTGMLADNNTIVLAWDYVDPCPIPFIPFILVLKNIKDELTRMKGMKGINANMQKGTDFVHVP